MLSDEKHQSCKTKSKFHKKVWYKSYLALVEVINNLLVELVLELSLCGGLVTISLCQVGCTWLVRPLHRTN